MNRNILGGFGLTIVIAVGALGLLFGASQPLSFAGEPAAPKVIAVLPFDAPAGIDGSALAELFSAELARANQEKLTVVESGRLDEILKEQRIELSGFVDSQTAVEVGRLTGVTHLLMGTVAADSAGLVITVRLADAMTGEASAPDIATSSRDAYLHTVVNMACDYVYRLTGEAPSLGGESLVPPELVKLFKDVPDPNALVEKSKFKVKFNLNVKGDTPVYHLGETLTVEAASERDCYLYIFNVSEGGGVKVIFPNMTARDNWIKAGQKVTIPAANAHFTWELGAPADGLEYVLAVATTTPIEFAPGMSDMIGKTLFPDVASDGGEFIAKQINVKLKEGEADEFGFGFARFYLAE